MKQGKISETILKRSILKNITFKRPEIIQGAGVGNDFSAIDLSKENVITACDTCFCQAGEQAEELIDRVCNNLMVSGATPVAVMVQLVLPVCAVEQEIKQVMRRLDERCRDRQVQIAGGNTIVSEQVSAILLSITGVGKVEKEKCWSMEQVKPGQEVVLCGCIARDMTKKLAISRREELLKRFSPSFLDKVLVWDNLLDIRPMIRVCQRAGIVAVHDLSESGIFGGLWEIAGACGCGIEAKISDILIRQETVELCEFFQMNPYEMPSVGNILAIAQEGAVLVDMLEQEGIRGAVIGRILEGNDKYVLCHDEKRYLTPPR